MKQSVLSHWDLPYLPITALIIFILCFSLFSYWTFKKSNKAIYENASKIPFKDPSKISAKQKGNK